MTSDTGNTSGKAPEQRRGGRRYNILVSLLFLLSCLGILTSTVVVWVHQFALSTDRWVEMVAPLPSNPTFRLQVSTKVANRVVTALDVEGRIAGFMPGRTAVVAGPIADQVEQGLQRRIDTAMASPAFQTAWVQMNRVAHQAIVNILRGNSQTVTIVDGYVVLDVWPLVGVALTQLQAGGIIPADVALPDLSQGLPPGAFDRLNVLLGGRIPADLGTFPLVPADKLEKAQSLVSIFDLVTIGLVIVTALLALLTIWYANRRLRMLVLLALGGLMALVLARFAIRGLEAAIVSSVSDDSTATTIREVISLVLVNLYAAFRVVILVSVVVAVVAYLAGRPSWLAALTTRGKPTTAAIQAGADSTTGTLIEVPRPSLVEMARENRRMLTQLGLGAVVFVVLWVVSGFWVALLAVLLLGLLQLGIGWLGGQDGASEVASGAGASKQEPKPGPTS